MNTTRPKRCVSKSKRYDEEFPTKLKVNIKRKSATDTKIPMTPPGDIVTENYASWMDAPDHIKAIGLSGDNHDYEVETILARRMTNEAGFKVNEYLIKWKGWDPRYNNWEPASNLKGCRRLMDAFNKKNTKKYLNENTSPIPTANTSTKVSSSKKEKIFIDSTPTHPNMDFIVDKNHIPGLIIPKYTTNIEEGSFNTSVLRADSNDVILRMKLKKRKRFFEMEPPIDIIGFSEHDGARVVCLKFPDRCIKFVLLEHAIEYWPIRMCQLKEIYHKDW